MQTVFTKKKKSNLASAYLGMSFPVDPNIVQIFARVSALVLQSIIILVSNPLTGVAIQFGFRIWISGIFGYKL